MIETARLVMRSWRDPEVMATLGPPLDMERTAALVARVRAVMERLGKCHHPDLDFDHPKRAEGDRLRPHVAYSIAREAWGRA